MEQFKQTISAYLKQRASRDKQFARKLKDPNKNIDDCCTYIINQVRKQGTAVALCDEEVYGMAVHYYDESDIQVGQETTCRIVHTELTDDTEPMITF